MSLDIYLVEPTEIPGDSVSIYIRDNGEIRRLTEEEWQEKFPEYEPVFIFDLDGENTVFEANITHNLGAMAAAAGLYDALWRPQEALGADFAEDLIDPLAKGIAELISNSTYFVENYSPENGWGSYENLLKLVCDYHYACIKHPQAKIHVSR